MWSYRALWIHRVIFDFDAILKERRHVLEYRFAPDQRFTISSFPRNDQRPRPRCRGVEYENSQSFQWCHAVQKIARERGKIVPIELTAIVSRKTQKKRRYRNMFYFGSSTVWIGLSDMCSVAWRRLTFRLIWSLFEVFLKLIIGLYFGDAYSNSTIRYREKVR